MKRIEYREFPSDGDSYLKTLKDNYLNIFTPEELNKLESTWQGFKKRNASLAIFKETIAELLVLDYNKLVDVYNRYVKYIQDSDRKKFNPKKKKRSLYNKCFNYDKYYDKIRAFFLDSKNGFEFHICHYCETAYINSFSVNQAERLRQLLNDSNFIEIYRGLKKRERSKCILIHKNIPFPDVSTMNTIVKIDYFKKEFLDKCGSINMATFDIDHVLDKSECPLVALSLFNFVPSCHVCNSRIKHTKVFGRNGVPVPCLSPTSKDYNFDREVRIRVYNKFGNEHIVPLEHRDEYFLKFETKNEDYQYEVDLLKLEDRYNYHISEALRLMTIKNKYNHSALKLMSSALPSDTMYSPESVEEDLLNMRFNKENQRCFEKLYRDINAYYSKR